MDRVVRLVDIDDYDQAQQHFSMSLLWEMFDGDRDAMNLAHECLDRHRDRGRAISVKHHDGRTEHLDYAQLADSTSQFAHWLDANNVSKGDRVAVILEPGHAFYTCMFGAIKRGAIAVPMFTLFGPEGLALRIRDCTPSIVLTELNAESIQEQFPDVRVITVNSRFQESLDAYPKHYAVDTRSTDLCVFQYTSGTTRELPEAVKHTQRSVVTLMIAALYGTGLRPDDRYFCPSSPAWGHGLWHGTIAPLALGIHIGAYAGKFDPLRILEALDELKVDNFAAAATVYRMIRNTGARQDYSIALKKCTFTGEPLDSNTFDWVVEAFGIAPASMYGTTEVGVIMVDYPGMVGHSTRKGALGKPAPGNHVAILRDDGAVAAPNEIGEIAVQRSSQWFRVKDFGYYDDDGYYFHAGRADDVIISAGWTMSAVEIENTLLKHAAIGEAAVIGVANKLRGQVPRAYVVLREGHDATSLELQDYMKQQLSKHEYPREIEFIESMPKTPAGKVNRKILRDLASTSSVQSQ
jgi:acetyl-CoA synthetase